MSELTGSHAVLLAAKFCRLSPLFRWCEEALWVIGRRENKFHFRVELTNLLSDRCGDMLLSIFPAHLSLLQVQRDSVLYKLKALLVTLKHPYILPTVDIAYSREQKALLVVQPFVATGSLRDRIFRCAPTRAFSDKYRVDRAAPLCLSEIRRFGAQILMALVALRQRGIVVEHLSSSNVIIEDGNARLSDLCNSILTIDRYRESRERTIAVEARGVDIDILLFGHLVYEMATGLELLSALPDERVLTLMDPSIAQVLRMIFFPDDLENEVAVADDASTSTEEEEQVDVEAEEENAIAVGPDTEPEHFLEETRNRLTLERIQQCELFAQADLPLIDSLFTGFRLDSSMKSTIRNSMRINQSRNLAYQVQFKEKEAVIRARKRAERRLAEDRERQQQRIRMMASNKVAAKQKKLLRSRSDATNSPSSSSASTTVKMSRRIYRADSSRLQRLTSSVTSA